MRVLPPVAALVLLAASTARAESPDAGPADAGDQGDGGAPAAAPTGEATLVAVGDVMLCRHVARVMKEKHDLNYPFLAVRDILRSADLAFGNLEGPITAGAEVKSGQMVFRADPGVEVALRDAGFAVLSLANNHTPDHGAKGITDTLAALKAVGIEEVGLGADDAEAARPVLIERHGIRFAFLAYNDPSVVLKSYGAAHGHPGTNLVDIAKVQQAVWAVRPMADIVIVSMHHGWEYRAHNPYQERFARAAIDAGADMVIGHHPHVVQSVERYKGRFIVYSLGNFVFDQTFSHAVRESVILRARFSKTGLTSLQLLPIQISSNAQPRLTGDAAIRARLQDRLGLPLGKDGFVSLVDEPPKKPARSRARPAKAAY